MNTAILSFVVTKNCKMLSLTTNKAIMLILILDLVVNQAVRFLDVYVCGAERSKEIEMISKWTPLPAGVWVLSGPRDGWGSNGRRYRVRKRWGEQGAEPAREGVRQAKERKRGVRNEQLQ
jgi:hypothetical protein